MRCRRFVEPGWRVVRSGYCESVLGSEQPLVTTHDEDVVVGVSGRQFADGPDFGDPALLAERVLDYDPVALNLCEPLPRASIVTSTPRWNKRSAMTKPFTPAPITRILAWLLAITHLRTAGLKSVLLRNRRSHRRFAERNTLCNQRKHPDVPRNRVMIMKLQDDTHNEEQASQHDFLLTDF